MDAFQGILDQILNGFLAQLMEMLTTLITDLFGSILG